MATEIEARLKITAQERTAKAFAAVEARLKKAERIADRVNRQQRQVALYEKTAGRVDRALLMGGTAVLGGLAAAGGVRRGLDTLTSYEDALIEIRKKGGLTAEQIKQVGAEAKALATSGDLAVPLDEILASYERAAAAGLPIEDWREFAALSAKAADAFGMSAEDVGNAAAGFKVGLGIPMTEMEQFFDLINALADSGISEESDIIKFLDNAGAGLKNFGLQAKIAAAYGATLLNLKLTPETGARMMGALTSKLLAPENLGKKGYTALGAVVGDVKAFKKEMKNDPQGALRKFLDQLSKLDKFQRAQRIGAIFGAEWTDEIMRLVAGLDELDRNIEQAQGRDWFGSLDKSYQMKKEALSARWQLFKNQIAELTIDLGELSMPALEAGLERARSLVKEIGEEIGKFGSEIDQEALANAQKSIDLIVSKIEELLNLNGEKSQIAQFFRDLASVTSDVATAVTNIQKGVAYIADPFGSADDGAAPKPGAPTPAKKSYLGGAFTITEGGIADSVIEGFKDVHDWMNWWNAEIKAAAAGLPPPPDPGSADLPPSALPSAASGPVLDDARQSTEAVGARPSLLPPLPTDHSLPAPNPLRQPEPAVLPRDRWLPAPPPLPSASDLPPLTLQIDGVDDTADALRQAMQQGGGEMRMAGSDSASAIRDAARELRSAAESIGENGRQAAAAISGARIQVPNVPSAPSASAAPARNLGQSMPTAGTPGGG